MRISEARRIYDLLQSFPDDSLSPMIEIGSSTFDFRTKIKPHIDKYLHTPLKSRGIKIITTDIKSGTGVMISGNIYDPNVFQKMIDLKPRSILLCNVLEHVEDIVELTALISKLISRNGIIVVTVPYDYPYHPDPIDTLYRPEPFDIANLFQEFEVVQSEIVLDVTYYLELKKMGFRKATVRVFIELIKLFRSLITLHLGGITHNRLWWIIKRYKVSLVILRKKEVCYDYSQTKNTQKPY